MRKHFWKISLLFAALVGCAPIQRAPQVSIMDVAPAPTCKSPKLCEAMWVASQDAVTTASGMKIRLVTDSRIETFSETGYGRAYGVVTKTPTSNGYIMSANFSCSRYPGCDSNRSLDTFNKLVNLQKIRMPGES